MKKLPFLFLALLMLFTGCTPTAQNIEEPVTFYYLRQDFDYNAADGVITSEIRESADCADETAILQRYFRGPEDPGLQCPFPTATELISLSIQENTATVTLTDNFSSLTGIDLTVACACISKTVIALTNTQQVTVKTQTQNLGGQNSITMTEADILLIDNSKNVIEPN